MATRRDRSSTALRPLALSQGLLSRADGSAQFSFGAVHPPRPPFEALYVTGTDELSYSRQAMLPCWGP